jgi:hypothetical protein
MNEHCQPPELHLGKSAFLCVLNEAFEHLGAHFRSRSVSGAAAGNVVLRRDGKRLAKVLRHAVPRLLARRSANVSDDFAGPRSGDAPDLIELHP